MKKIFIITAALFLFTMSGFAQIKVWRNGTPAFTTDQYEVDSITFGIPYPALSINEICGDKGWIEIYNKSDFKINLEGLKLVKIGDTGQDEILTTFGAEEIKDKSYFVKKIDKGLSNTENLKLGLQTPDGTTFEIFDGALLFKGQFHANGGSYSRIPDGIGKWKMVSESSENTQNNYGQAEMPEFPVTLIHNKIWGAKYAEFQKDEAIFLRVTEDNQLDFDYSKGEYVYITAKEFGEDYQTKYNAANGTDHPIEFFLRFDYDDTHYYEITFTEDMKCVIWDGNWTPYGEVAVMQVSGKYTLNEETGMMYIRDTESNSLYDKDVQIQITRDPDVENGLIFEIVKNKVLDPAYDMGFDYDRFGYSFYDYDQENKYFPAKKILYHCEEIEISHH